MALFSRVLVNLPAAERPSLLLEKAARLTAEDGLLELFQCGWQPLFSSMSLLPESMREQIKHQQLKRMEAHLDQLADQLRRQLPLSVATDVAWSRDEADGVLTRVERLRADLLVHEVAEHPHLLHRLLAPQDWRLLREVNCPLLLSKARPWPDHLRIAAAIDPFHLHDEAAQMDACILDYAQALSARVGGELHLVHAFTAIPQAAVFDEHLVADFEALQTRVRQEHQQRFRELVSTSAPHLDPALVHLEEGEIGEVLSRFVAEQEIDILVMGSLARGFVDQLLLGSTAERMVDALPCDLLVLKADQKLNADQTGA